MTDQVAGIYRKRVGDFVVTSINDGTLDLPLEVMLGIDPQEASALLAAQFRRPTPHLSVNTFLVQGQGRTVLIDTGSGNGMGPSMGRLLPNLFAAGVRPGDVDLVLLTHLHPDHSGGLATAEGGAVFPNAALGVAAKDAEFWLDVDPETMAEGIRPYVRGAQAAVAPYTARLTRLDTAAAAPGITPVPLPGHTPGHCGYRIGDGADALLIWGDVMHIPDVQSAHPHVGMVFDVDAETAVATRRRVLDMAAADRLAVAGMHLYFPCFAHVARTGTGYAMVPDAWEPAV